MNGSDAEREDILQEGAINFVMHLKLRKNILFLFNDFKS